jgi:hypothetical protein
MNSLTHLRLIISICIFTLLTGANVALAGRPGKATCPDFTKGDKIPEGYTHDCTLGPTGMRGWIFCDRHTTTSSRQIKVTKVEKGSPADGVLEVGDVILGAGGRLFDDDARILFGKAITKAEKTEYRGRLSLILWRNGKIERVVLLPLGSCARAIADPHPGRPDSGLAGPGRGAATRAAPGNGQRGPPGGARGYAVLRTVHS